SQTAENLAEEHGITRADADQFALLSQTRAARAAKAGYFKEEIVPVTVRERGQERVVAEDNHPRPDTTLEGLAKLPPAFGGKGFVTAGNASGIVDGAAAVVVASPRAAADLKTRPLGRLVGAAVAGVPPRIMGIGPVPSIRKALERAGLAIGEID